MAAPVPVDVSILAAVAGPRTEREADPPPPPRDADPPDEGPDAIARLVASFNLTDLPEGISAAALEPRLRALVDELRAQRADALRQRIVRGVLVEHLKKAKVPGAAALVDAALISLATKAPAAGLEDDAPAADPVALSDLLTEIQAKLEAHVIFTNAHSSTAIALWIVVTYLHQVLSILPMLTISSPTKRAGKTTLLALLEALCRRALMASNISGPALYRAVETFCPTLLLDEADTWLPDREELRGIVNSGHTRTGAKVIRCSGDDAEPTIFSTWCPKVLAMIGTPADTITDRSIVIPLRRKHAGDRVVPLRLDRLRDEVAYLRQAARRAADDALEVLRRHEPAMPAGLNDRANDNWRPLVALADLAGNEWPGRARAAALDLTAANEDVPLTVELLRDLRGIFDAHDDEPHLATSKVVDALKALPERPWATWGKGEKGLTQHALARLLKPFGVHSSKVKAGTDAVNAYRRADLEDAWRRYLPPDPGNDSEPGTTPENTGAIGHNLGSGSEAPLGTSTPGNGNGSGSTLGTGTALVPDLFNESGLGSEFRPETGGREDIADDLPEVGTYEF